MPPSGEQRRPSGRPALSEPGGGLVAPGAEVAPSPPVTDRQARRAGAVLVATGAIGPAAALAALGGEEAERLRAWCATVVAG